MQEQARHTFFMQVKKHTHLVIDAAPSGPFFTRQRQQYPGIANNCQVLWYQDWSQAALHSVCAKMLAQVETNSIQIDQALVDLSVDIHNSAAIIADKFQQVNRRQ